MGRRSRGHGIAVINYCLYLALVRSVALPTLPMTGRNSSQLGLQHDPFEAILRLKRKPSYLGGRPLATPYKTAQQLGVARRNRSRHQSSLEGASRELEVRLIGSLGPTPHAILQ